MTTNRQMFTVGGGPIVPLPGCITAEVYLTGCVLQAMLTAHEYWNDGGDCSIKELVDEACSYGKLAAQRLREGGEA